MDSIISSVITGFLSLLGVCIATLESNKKFESKMEKSQAVTDCKIDELTREINKQNILVENIPVIQEQIKNIQKCIEDRKER